MAIDNTPPRLKLIATIAIITVVTLISLDFVFKSYYAMMTDEAAREKVAPTTVAHEQHKAEQAALTGANIDQAMKTFASGQRPDSINPVQSEDMGPMTGWSKLPKPAPTPQPHAAPPTTDLSADGGTLLAGDGGIMLAGDGGVAGEAGAPPPRHRERGDGGAGRPHGDRHGGPHGDRPHPPGQPAPPPPPP